MKKFIICSFIGIILVNCDIHLKSISSQSISETHSIQAIHTGCKEGNCISYQKTTIDGVEYGIFVRDKETSAPFVLNLTREALEIEFLKKRLKRK